MKQIECAYLSNLVGLRLKDRGGSEDVKKLYKGLFLSLGFGVCKHMLTEVLIMKNNATIMMEVIMKMDGSEEENELFTVEEMVWPYLILIWF